jgi:hypothetical protein
MLQETAINGDPNHTLTDAHAGLARVAGQNNCVSSRLVGTVSRHVMTNSVSFRTLSALHSAANELHSKLPCADFLATSGSDVVYSVKLRYAPPHEPVHRVSTKKRKRERHEDFCERVELAVHKLEMTTSIPKAELDVAEAAIMRILRDLRGPEGEDLVQSFGLFVKRLGGDSIRQSLVLAIRINAGLAVPLAQLKRCLGSCWKDGLVSSAATVMGVCDSDLPLTEEGTASMEFGNNPLLLVTSVPFAAHRAE